LGTRQSLSLPSVVLFSGIVVTVVYMLDNKKKSEVALPSAMVMALGKENTEIILKHVIAECWDRALGKENNKKILKQVCRVLG